MRFTHLTRENLFAERYYGEEETAHLDSDALSLWGEISIGGIKWIPGFSIARKNIKHNTPNFSRNIIDQDGSGFQPWYADATIVELTYNNHLEWATKLPWVSSSLFKADWDNSFVIHHSDKASSHAIYFEHQSESDPSPTGYTNQSLYVVEFENRPFGFYLGHLASEFAVEKKFFTHFLHLKLSGGLVLDTLFLKDRSKALLDLEYKVHTDFVKHKNIYFAFKLGQKSIPFGSELALFMSKDYLDGTYYFWNDTNANGISESREFSERLRTTGGRYHEYAERLRHPNFFYMDIPLDIKMGKYVAFNTTVSYKLFKHLFKVRFQDNPDRTIRVTTGGEGDLETETNAGGERVFVYEGGETRYVLGNEEDDVIDEAPSFFFSRPFYAGVLWKLAANTKHVFFSASFKAYIVAGPNKYGNGFNENNLGTFSEEDANPNTDINSSGRLRQDKGYIGKLHLAFSPRVKDLWTSLSLKYRDGTPIAHYEYYLHEDGNRHQAAIWNQGVNGHNPFADVIGQREDSLWNLDWDVRYAWKGKRIGGFIYFQVYNLLDLGNELVEMTFRDGRRALETEQPRGVRTGIQISF